MEHLCMIAYKKRVADALLARKLKGVGAVLIQGPKWCGKTTTAAQLASSVIYMDDPEVQEQYVSMASLKPRKLLEGPVPRLIDEWQIAPELWDAIRFEVDHRGSAGQFILTGSAVPADMSKVHHSGTGRFAWLVMRPMSLYESGDSSGEVSLEALFHAPKGIEGTSSLDIDRLAFLICRGGWPASLDKQDDIALDLPKDYIDAVIHSDIKRSGVMTKSPDRIAGLLRSYARAQGSQTPNTEIAKDINADDGTVEKYLSALEKLFVVEELPAWNPNLRSKTAVRTSSTRYFVDPSLAVAALGAEPSDLVGDLRTMGFFFETLCMRDLRVFADALDGHVYRYRDKNGLECDAVVHLRDGSYGLIEMELGGESAIEEGAASLQKLAAKIDTSRMRSPSFLMVLVGVGRFAYQREDGVYVVPVGCLKD